MGQKKTKELKSINSLYAEQHWKTLNIKVQTTVLEKQQYKQINMPLRKHHLASFKACR